MVTKIEIGKKPELRNLSSRQIVSSIRDLNISAVKSVNCFEVFYLLGDLSDDQLLRICEELLVDKITQQYAINQPLEQES
ncbi:MAG: phosphoribosylformylglycinamidine synthase subunit PurS, partial [bacterium]|nr:phosphoribosylformylglycinamidine synthase subunit PurS [bacterium]